MIEQILCAIIISLMIIVTVTWKCSDGYQYDKTLTNCYEKSNGTICEVPGNENAWAWCHNGECLPELIRNGPP